MITPKKAKPRKPKNKRQRWRDVPDSILLANGRKFSGIPSDESLHPGLGTIHDYIYAHAEAIAIIDSWAFRYPISLRTVAA